MRKILAIAFVLLSAGAGAKVSVVEYSTQLLGTPYMASPLGEGSPDAYDPDPLIRFDGFDCQTFVETVLARGDEATLTEIRYAGGKPGFSRRHHFTDMWVRGNKSRLSDITKSLSLMALGRPASMREGVIDEAAWFKKIHGQEVSRPARHVVTHYIPREEILEQRQKFSAAVAEPMVALLVFKDFSVIEKLGTDLHVAHMGLLLPTKGDGLTFRHASSAGGKVMDVDFFKYLDLLPPSYIGVQIFSIRE